jgi:hypothetical protein
MASILSSPGMRQQRIRKVSRFFRWLSVYVGVMAVLSVSWSFVLPVIAVEPLYADPGSRPNVEPAPETFSKPKFFLVVSGTAPVYRVFTWDIRAGGSGIREGREWMARSAAALWSVYLLMGAVLCYRLFQSYERREFFAIAGVRCLKWVGIWMMGFWGVGLLFQFSSRWWAESMNLRFDLGAGLLPGLFVFLIGWILEEAHQIAEEQALTV